MAEIPRERSPARALHWERDDGLRSNQQRRAVLVETFRELANLSGRCLGARAVCRRTASATSFVTAGAMTWLLLVSLAVWIAGMTMMVDTLYPIWIIILIGFVIALLDWLGRRRHRQSKHRS